MSSERRSVQTNNPYSWPQAAEDLPLSILADSYETFFHRLIPKIMYCMPTHSACGKVS